MEEPADRFLLCVVWCYSGPFCFYFEYCFNILNTMAMVKKISLPKITYSLGRCMPTSKTDAAKIQIKRLALNEKYLMVSNPFEIHLNKSQSFNRSIKLCYQVNTLLSNLINKTALNFLLQCYNQFECVYANDPNKLCKTGDTVLIKSLPQRLTRLIRHEVIMNCST